MSASHVVVGGAIVTVLGQLVLTSILPSPAPITVHGLEYHDGVIMQSRTVDAEQDAFPAQWRATVYHAATDQPVEGCKGEGFWNYTSGHYVAELPLPEWVGSETCTVEYLQGLGGDFYGRASWHWGDEFTQSQTEVFTP